MTEIKQIDVIGWEDKRLLKFLEKIEGDVVLIDEESAYCVLFKEEVVVEETSSRHLKPSYYKYPIKVWIKDLRQGVR